MSTQVTADQVEAVLATGVRKYIQTHAGDVHVSKVEDNGDVTVAFSGACGRCPALSATFAIRVMPALKELDGVNNVNAEGVHLSQAAIRRVATLFGAKKESPQA
jgi:Fe-S cluster biogenesis protein NfuA